MLANQKLRMRNTSVPFQISSLVLKPLTEGGVAALQGFGIAPKASEIFHGGLKIKKLSIVNFKPKIKKTPCYTILIVF